MTARIFRIGRPLGLILALLLVMGLAYGRERGIRTGEDFSRFSISLGCGIGFLENEHGTLDLASEFQFSLSPRFRIGLGLGYISDLKMRWQNIDDREKNWDGSTMGNKGLRGSIIDPLIINKNNMMREGSAKEFRIAPLTLNLYYCVPVGRRLIVFMSGGASYNLGKFYEGTWRQRKHAWGGQAGLGAELRLIERISFVVEGSYRFVEFHGLKWPQPQVQNPGLSLEELWRQFKPTVNKDDFTSWLPLFNAILAQGGVRPPVIQNEPNFMNLNGFSFRTGLKFSL